MTLRTTALATLVALAVSAALLLLRKRRPATVPPQGRRRRVPGRRTGDSVLEDLTGRPVPRSVTAVSPPPHVEQLPGPTAPA
ncbi:MAG TPA: hypothetical protein VFQ11_11735 [Nocardioidaceae bacterium]|jgi:hypothetical protein|nr:hypothetical protein [Nocardioidaceae bacterium]